MDESLFDIIKTYDPDCMRMFQQFLSDFFHPLQIVHCEEGQHGSMSVIVETMLADDLDLNVYDVCVACKQHFVQAVCAHFSVLNLDVTCMYSFLCVVADFFFPWHGLYKFKLPKDVLASQGPNAFDEAMSVFIEQVNGVECEYCLTQENSYLVLRVLMLHGMPLEGRMESIRLSLEEAIIQRFSGRTLNPERLTVTCDTL